ncbi:hypothetical protein DL95DRAFT_325995 [Leptodontidium sp. 2 PMI_412]|nr:hypothetical protein BKA61DRAFT_225789 [Leptodontidium sp. MPI-SDFR-AT-0119]KAH9222872.1 hypothetical protein DL95DRAFT_325995 [Leptodontidium sp. 2 PMI_412]
MAPTTAMDVALENGSPSSRRNKGKIAEAIQSMSNLNASMEALDLPTDPDAQATVTDFLDFTEYLPADMIRSLTLIRNLDETYTDASSAVNDLTKKYGNLPNIAPDKKPDPVKLREEISQNLEQAVGARTLAHAEASRMAENVERHYNRAKNILAKLQAMAENYPPSREPSPVPEKAKSPAVARPPKIMLRLGGEQPAPIRIRKHRAPRITVPGEVLAPYELDYESYGSESDRSDSDENEPITPRATPGVSLNLGTGKIKLKISKPVKKDKTQKPPRQPRPPGVMGTNVHSAVAGISTSNALAMLNPPPAGAVKGDDSLPWLQLNDWELAILRKRMKKNAIWSPSDTMIARELKQLGRGIEAYRAARAEAEAAGIPYDKPEPPQLRGETVHAEGAISVEALRSSDPQLSNRGMKLNEAKKLKKENQAKELAKQAVEEAEESARKMAQFAEVMKGLFKAPQNDDKKSSAKTPSKSKTPARKRKRETPPEGETEGEKTTEGETKPTRPLLKRNKTETPVPAPQPIATKQSPILPPESAASVTSEAAPLPTPIEVPTNPLSLPLPVPSPKKSSTPILPPSKEPRKAIKKEAKKMTETATNTRPRRTSLAGLAATPPNIPEPLPLKRPTSSRSKATSVEPAPLTGSSAVDRPRRASTARNTPAPAEPRQASKRAKRPAPGVVTTGSEGSASVSVGKRKAATRKKTSTKKEKKDGREGSAVQEVLDVEVDDEGNVIDPQEPRYCLCNRVSFGTMIGCENHDCEKEWFHLECVALTEVPPRTTKWYCPECRVTLGIGEKGEVTARGKKK